MGSCKSHRSSHVLDKGTSSDSIDECLPQEMLEAILGKLDRETLITARLVSRTFCAAASANITSLTLRRPSQAVSLERFPLLGHVRVHHSVKDCSPAQLDPRLRAAITHLTLSQGRSCIRRGYSHAWDDARMALPELPGMPKLRELEVEDVKVDGAEVLHRLTNLEVLRIGGCAPPVAMTIMTATWLTSLAIGWVTRPDKGWDFRDFSWLQHATNLRNLQALQISVFPGALPLIGKLTGLTGFTWWDIHPENLKVSETYSIAPLSHLSRLRSLHIRHCISESNLAIACSLGSGSLTNLCLWVNDHASADCGRLLARQTALKQLSICGERVSNLRHMEALRMELLQSLELPWLGSVDAEGLDVLQKATSLTKLGIITSINAPGCPEAAGFSQTLGRLTQLRSLQLVFYAHSANHLELPSTLSRLTALTNLEVYTRRMGNGELRALLGLTCLQVLDVHGSYRDGCHLTDDVVPELGVLTNLRCLNLRLCGVTSLAPATNILNPLREARGWPPVEALCE